MNRGADRLIESDKDSLLEKASLASHLGKAICECGAKDGSVTGIHGEWGNGKASATNMATHTVEEVYKEESNRPIAIEFSPWNYSEQGNLINIFFNSLQNQITIKGDDEFKKEVGKALSDYVGAFDALSIIPVLGPGFVALLKVIAVTKGNYLMQEVNLGKARMDLEDRLIRLNGKTIVITDDIDRLTSIRIKDASQLIRQVTDFPSIVYLLATDRKIACHILKEVHSTEGNEYLEKIIRVSLEIPPLQKVQINEISLGRLAEVDDGLVCCNKEIDYS